MNIVFFSPHFPPHYSAFCRQLKNTGATVLGIGDEEYDKLAETLRTSLTEYYRVEVLHDYDALVRACGYFIHRYGRIDRFESHNEYWLENDARIRDDFNIPGLRHADIQVLRRKSGMKALFREAGLKVAPGILARSLDEARNLASSTGFPIIAKPDAGVGALDTLRIDNAEELERFFTGKPDVDYFLEAFVRGDLYSFDGMTDAGGSIVFQTAHFFSQGIMETVNEGRHIYYYNLKQIPPALAAAGSACVAAFRIRERFFHIEFFRTAENEFLPLEVNLRPPGGFTTDMFNYAADVDIYRAWAEVVVNGATTLDYHPSYHCCYASRKSHLRYRHSEDAVRSRFPEAVVKIDHVPGVFRSALGDVGFIVRTRDLDTLLEIVRTIHETEP